MNSEMPLQVQQVRGPHRGQHLPRTLFRKVSMRVLQVMCVVFQGVLQEVCVVFDGILCSAGLSAVSAASEVLSSIGGVDSCLCSGFSPAPAGPAAPAGPVGPGSPCGPATDLQATVPSS